MKTSSYYANSNIHSPRILRIIDLTDEHSIPELINIQTSNTAVPPNGIEHFWPTCFTTTIKVAVLEFTPRAGLRAFEKKKCQAHNRLRVVLGEKT
ncbi:hypothetical protein ANTPLA_LOCUS9060 [Anthophora plagiata]